ncbi:MAG: Tim44/TimA family putative adaptor protein [Bdellovibrionales bacterium]
MTGELLIYALVAGGLVFWLRSLLGTRHGEERDRSDNIISLDRDNQTYENNDLNPVAPISAEDQIQNLQNDDNNVTSIESKTAEEGLLLIADADKDFDVKFFSEAVQDVFAMVVEGFAEGDREMLQDLLSDNVYTAFESAMDAREKAGETMLSEIQAIKKAEIIEADLNGKTANITVRFLASELTVTKDKDDEILSGHPDREVDMRDIWTFSRDLKSRDPRWFVVETRGDFEGDNETIPNSN